MAAPASPPRPKSAPRSGPAANAPPAPPPSRAQRGSWFLPTLIAVAVAVAGVTALFLYPVTHNQSNTFTIQTENGHTAPVNHTVTFGQTGTYSFGYSSDPAVYVTFDVYGPGGTHLYHAYNYLAAGSFHVQKGDAYIFSVTYNVANTVTVNGNLQWTAPSL
jgi:hypothetical protein